jgi:hypothetical protein
MLLRLNKNRLALLVSFIVSCLLPTHTSTSTSINGNCYESFNSAGEGTELYLRQYDWNSVRSFCLDKDFDNHLRFDRSSLRHLYVQCVQQSNKAENDSSA